MERLRIYIDTSVLGGCFDSEFAVWSNALGRDFRARHLVPVLSDVTGAEIAGAPEAVRDLHQDLLVIKNREKPVFAVPHVPDGIQCPFLGVRLGQ